MSKVQNTICLMYHGITGQEPLTIEREQGAELYDVALTSFSEQMQWLKNNGYTGVSVEQTGDKQVIITFDDGEMNNFTNAFPVLSELGFTAYFFIISRRVGKSGYMGWDEIKKLHEGGMKIGSHGLSHEILTNLKDTQIEEELIASKKHLQRNLEIPIDTLSIPRGFCTDKILEMAYAAGYKTVFISERPRHLKAQALSRVAIKRDWSVKRFALAMEGKVPPKEIITNAVKRMAKLILRESGYNKLRSLIIQVFK